MPKKLTIEFVRDEFAKEGYTLLSKEYKNCSTKLNYICSNNHKHSMKWNDWKSGTRCPYCIGNIKYNIEFIKEEFAKEGYTLLSKEYKNNHTKLEYECPNKHRHSIIWRNWQRGDRCPYCAGQGKPAIEFIRSEFKKEGYNLLTKTYINNSTKLEYICSKGHKHSITWRDWQRGSRCFYCSNKVRPSIINIKNSFEKEGYILLTKKYINNKTKLDYICPEGHQHSITWGNWISGYRCPICASIKFSGSGHPNWQGGKSFEPYCEAWKDKEYKADIRKRDGNKCLNPYCSSKNPDDLTIHHIDFNKKNCHPSNLITVCRSCNSCANTDRDWHTAWYQIIMNRRYKYIYGKKKINY